jgi:hypothetical protein
MTWSEFDGLLRAIGIRLTRYHAKKALSVAPPDGRRVRGGLRYEQRHVRLAREYAEVRFCWKPTEVA